MMQEMYWSFIVTKIQLDFMTPFLFYCNNRKQWNPINKIIDTHFYQKSVPGFPWAQKINPQLLALYYLSLNLYKVIEVDKLVLFPRIFRMKKICILFVEPWNRFKHLRMGSTNWVEIREMLVRSARTVMVVGSKKTLSLPRFTLGWKIIQIYHLFVI